MGSEGIAELRRLPPSSRLEPAQSGRDTSGMPLVLPPSLRKELHPIEEEVAWARSLTPEQRLAAVAALCRDNIALLNMNPHRDAVLARRDPLPASTIRALARLRIQRG